MIKSGYSNASMNEAISLVDITKGVESIPNNDYDDGYDSYDTKTAVANVYECYKNKFHGRFTLKPDFDKKTIKAIVGTKKDWGYRGMTAKQQTREVVEWLLMCSKSSYDQLKKDPTPATFKSLKYKDDHFNEFYNSKSSDGTPLNKYGVAFRFMKVVTNNVLAELGL